MVTTNFIFRKSKNKNCLFLVIVYRLFSETWLTSRSCNEFIAPGRFYIRVHRGIVTSGILSSRRSRVFVLYYIQRSLQPARLQYSDKRSYFYYCDKNRKNRLHFVNHYSVGYDHLLGNISIAGGGSSIYVAYRSRRNNNTKIWGKNYWFLMSFYSWSPHMRLALKVQITNHF